MNTEYSVIVVEDEPWVAQDLCAILAAAGYKTFPPVTRGAEAESAIAESRPDLVLLDIALDHGLSGIEVAAHLRATLAVPIVFVSAHSDPDTIRRAVEVEPRGFVVKPFIPEQVVATVSAAIRQKPSVLNTKSAPGLSMLTKRERQVLEALLSGRRISGIAAMEGLSVHTIRNQVKSIMFKLDVHSQDELVTRFTARER
ncbi:MAG: DNA-binding response regulator [Deltaproteobacteria bacterium]|nr:DNA-binding response regulator [Deltaproteobacteria bacterium]